MTDVSVDGYVEQEFLPYRLHGQYTVHKVAESAGQGAEKGFFIWTTIQRHI